MDAEHLQDRINAAPALRRLQAKLQDTLQFHAVGAAQLDPILVLTIISTLIQVIIYCRKKQTEDDIAATIRDLRTVPPRKLIRVRRQLKKAWDGYCAERQIDAEQKNPILPALYEISETLGDDDIRELLALAPTE
jgi:hypothetical protein